MRENREWIRAAELAALSKRAQIEERILSKVLYEALDSEHITTHQEHAENFK